MVIEAKDKLNQVLHINKSKDEGYWKYSPETNNYDFVEGTPPSVNGARPLVQEPSYPHDQKYLWAKLTLKEKLF